MKNKILTALFSAALLLLSVTGYTQGPPPPPTGVGHGATGNQNGGSAPVGGGLFILLGLGAAYGGKKLYHLTKHQDKA